MFDRARVERYNNIGKKKENRKNCNWIYSKDCWFRIIRQQEGQTVHQLNDKVV